MEDKKKARKTGLKYTIRGISSSNVPNNKGPKVKGKESLHMNKLELKCLPIVGHSEAHVCTSLHTYKLA